ncbi:MAG TPA: CHAT domain-containing tetratricopeptide repeat protein, partial [Thermoanaerobaculia bacterium]|nr:CHAT domain-containing tetratricopeptide repeat protein [Thermoanaerobaculia bacterium]
MTLRRWFILIGFALLAVPGGAQTSEPTDSKLCQRLSEDDISARLEARLKALPDRWDKIPPPLVPISGRSSEEVLATASEEEKAVVSEWITFLALSPPAERAALINRELQTRPPSEVDVWLPEKFTDDLRTTSLEEPTLYVEAWLEWAEALGRKDALLLAASMGLERLSLRGESRSLLQIASRLASLPALDYDIRGRANVLSRYADQLYYGTGENEKALDAYRSARKLFEQIGDRRGQGNTFKGEADVLYQMDDHEKTLEGYRSARKLYEEVGDRRGLGYTFIGEARMLSHLDDNEKALDAYRSARKLYEEIGDRRGLGYTFIGEAHVLSQLNDNEKALDACRSARKLYEEVGDRRGLGYTFIREAVALFELGDTEKALDANRSARKLFEQVGNKGQENTWLFEASVLFWLGEDEKALDALRSRRKLEVGDSEGLGFTLLEEARLQSRQGNENVAKNLASQAVAALREEDEVASERDAWLVVAEAEHSLRNLEPAVSAAREAIRLHAAWRSSRISETQRARVDESISAAYDILVPVLLSQARTEQALAAAEEARSHVFLDLLAAGFRRGKPGAAIDLRAERQRLVSELAQVETESRQAADAGRLAELQIHRNQIDHKLDWNQRQTLAAEQDALLTAQPLDASGIRAVARETGPILLYYAAEKELIGFLVPSDGTDIFAARIDLPRDRLTEAVQHYVHDEANTIYADRAAQQSRELWDLLLAPFAARLPAGGPLVIVPHGPLHELPFETLLDPAGAPLLERWAVSTAPSVSTLARARERHKEPQPQDSFLAFSSGRGLKLTDAETGEVAQLFGNNKASFKPTEARFENYEHLVPGVRQLLISTTGTWAPGDQRKTYLEILPTRDVHDSRLSVVEIAALPLTAELVTLAACDTARGETRSTDERVDLTRAFLTAGAASVLSTRWKVPEDPATTRFLLDFYRAYRQGGPGGKGLRKDQALTEARRRSRERGDPA